MNKDKKFLILFGIIVLIIAGIIFLLGMRDDEEFVVKNEFDSRQDYLNYLEDYEDAQKADTFGGTTPEETLDLFITALRAGDMELASKYFVVERQEEMKRDLGQGIENGAVDVLLEFYSFDNKDVFYIEYSNEYEIEYLDKNKKGPGFVFRLILNTQTNIWKIKSL